jgi:hypothetical protein
VFCERIVVTDSVASLTSFAPRSVTRHYVLNGLMSMHCEYFADVS